MRNLRTAITGCGETMANQSEFDEGWSQRNPHHLAQGAIRDRFEKNRVFGRGASPMATGATG